MKPSRARQNNAITCSRECLAVLRSRNTSAARRSPGPRTAVCETCSITFERKASQLAKYGKVYCSRPCKYVGDVGPKPELRNGQMYPCVKCGKDVWRTPATLQPRTYCSHACFHADNPKPRGQRVERIVKACANACGVVLRLQPSHAKRYKYCSPKCAAQSTQGARRGLPGRAWPAEQRAKLARTLLAKYRNEWAEKGATHSVRMTGERNPAWLDGRRLFPYVPGFTKTTKARIARRDGQRCRICGAPRRPGTHVVHHIDGEKHNHDDSNLVLLCQPCHGKVHWAGLEIPLEVLREIGTQRVMVPRRARATRISRSSSR